MKNLVLASTSIYRAELLKKLGILFSTQKPSFDEDSAKTKLLEQKKTAVEIAEALSIAKAMSIDSSQSTVIAGDQLIHFNEKILGKSGNFTQAFNQLKMLCGQTHELITAVTILSDNQKFHLNHCTLLKMKNLTDYEIESYLKKDQPFDCAGSYKIEKSGLILFDEIITDDFSAIQGLPLIWISKKLKELGYEFFTC